MRDEDLLERLREFSEHPPEAWSDLIRTHGSPLVTRNATIALIEYVERVKDAKLQVLIPDRPTPNVGFVYYVLFKPLEKPGLELASEMCFIISERYSPFVHTHNNAEWFRAFWHLLIARSDTVAMEVPGKEK